MDGKEKNVMPVSTAEYNPCGWRAWLNNTTITLGMQNVLDADPPFVAGSGENGYDESLCHDQRPVLVRPAEEKILRNLFACQRSRAAESYLLCHSERVEESLTVLDYASEGIMRSFDELRMTNWPAGE